MFTWFETGVGIALLVYTAKRSGAPNPKFIWREVKLIRGSFGKTVQQSGRSSTLKCIWLLCQLEIFQAKIIYLNA